MSKLSSAAEYEDGIVEGGRPSRLLAFLPYLLILTLTLRRGGLHKHQQEAACCVLGSARCDYGGVVHR